MSQNYINLEKKGEHFFVNATINSQNTVRLLVDTGASQTTINREIISEILEQQDISLESLATKSFKVADGRSVKAYIYNSNSIEIKNTLFYNIPIAFFESELNNSEAHGLLGMDILNKFDLKDGKLYPKKSY